MDKRDKEPSPSIAALLCSEVRVVNIGLRVFAVELAAAGVAVVDLDWSPPLGNPRIRALLSRLSRP